MGLNYYIEPAAKEYIQKQKRAHNKHSPTRTPIINIPGEGTSSNKSYKECITKGLDPLDGEYIDWKKEVKEEILTEVLKEMKNKFDNTKKEYDDKYDINNFLEEDNMDVAEHEEKVDIRGHGQPLE